MNPPRSVQCAIPASTSNCGSGFDTLGIALTLYNRVRVERRQDGETVGCGFLEGNEMAREVVAAFFEEAGIDPFPVAVCVEGDVPPARGLGSSVTLRGGILACLRRLAGVAWTSDRLVRLLTRLEGHPDNASASLLGGFTVSRFSPTPADWQATMRFEIDPAIRFVAAIPEREVLTAASRVGLPASISFHQAVGSLNSVACLVAALVSGQHEQLRNVVEDHLHQPFRMAGIPGAADAISSGVEAGAYTGWLSGSGSSVLCVCSREAAPATREAMLAGFSRHGVEARGLDLGADNQGIQVSDEE